MRDSVRARIETSRDAVVTNLNTGGLGSFLASDVRANVEPQAIFLNGIDTCPFGIVLVEPLGQIVFANSEMERLFGYTRDELIGQTIDILVSANLRARRAQHCGQFAVHPGNRAGGNGMLSGRRKDGSEFPIELGLNPIEISGGNLTLGAIVDISERIHMEQLKDEFMATVSHELRTPLASIAGALGLLINEAGEALPAATRRLLTIAHTNSQRLVRLVNSILDMEKIESGNIVFTLKRVEVRSLVEHAIEANRGFADVYGVRIRLNAPSMSEEMCVDPDWLVQVVTNLLSNAVKFSPRGTEVVVAIESRNGRIRISVRDRGRGVPAHFRGRIFEKFAQADVTDPQRHDGTGLGLSIVKQIVTRLGGDVGFDDAPGGGAIFHVELPGCEQKIAMDPNSRQSRMRRRPSRNKAGSRNIQ